MKGQEQMRIRLFCLVVLSSSGCEAEEADARENSPVLCSDDEDNDNDGHADCDDPDCRRFCEVSNEPESCGIPESFGWNASEPLISPPEGSVSIKDPSVVFYDERWHVYATHFASNYSMVYLNFEEWEAADDAEKIPVDTNPNLTDYKCAPQIFYFTPQDLWYLVYQTQPPAYSTTTDITDVSSWSAPKLFMSIPRMVADNSEYGGIDYWIICDKTHCYIFFSADNGFLYRAKTTKEDFPNGFKDTTEVVMEDNRNALFEAANVYKLASENKYLLIHEAIGGSGRYFRSWTADRLDSNDWTPLADTEQEPFASVHNVTGADWSNDGISHGEMLRYNPDETMTISTCDMRYLFQGRTATGSEYNLNEYSLGLLSPEE